MRLSLLKPKTWFCRLLLLSLLPVIGTTGGLAKHLPIKSYTTADGLARDYIDRIVLDSHGFLWFCTPEGLSRFDGYSFVNYGSEQGLPPGAVGDLFETRDGAYWVATTNGVCRFNLFAAKETSTSDKEQSNSRAFGVLASSPKFVCYRPEGNERAQVVNTIREDRNGTLWCGTSGGLFHLEQSNDGWVFIAAEIGIPAMPRGDASVSTIIEDRSGVLWVGAGSGLFRRLPDGRAERYTTAQGLPDNDVRALLEDRDGRIWVGTTQGLCELVSQPDPHTLIVAHAYTVKNGLANNYITALHQSEGRMWIGTGAGLNEFVPSTSNAAERFRTYTTVQGLSGKEIESLGEDRDGNLWIGTESSGAMQLARHGFATYVEEDGLSETRIASIIEDASGQLCVISSRSNKLFMHRFDGTKFMAIRPNLRGDIKRSWGWNQIVFQDSAREWWVDTAEGLYRFPQANGVDELSRLRPAAVYTTKDGLTGNEIFRLYEDRRGDVWISIADSLKANLARWERATGKFYQYGGTDALPAPNAPTAFREDSAGNLWIGLYYGGLVRYRADQFTRFTNVDGLPPGLIRDLYVDRSGKLWIATNRGGLARVDDPSAERPRFITYTTREGLASNQALCVTEDQHGRIYIGTAKGLDRLDPLTGHLKHYSEANGLANNFVNVAYRDRQGALWFGTLHGLSQLMPERDRPISPSPVLISKVRVAGMEQALSDLSDTNAPSLVLAPDRNQVQIDFVGLSFAAGEILRYQTKLEGADREWSAPTDQRTVNYAQLAPGTYRFLVRAVNNDGAISPHSAAISFRILPHIWQRWWFFALVALFVASLAYFVYQYRVNQLLELERVRTRIATDLHDDIGSSLSRMAILSEVVKRDKTVMPSASVERLTDIAETARSLVDTMSDIVWSIDPRRDDLRSVIMRVRQFASDVLEAQGIKWRLEAAPELDHIKLTPEQRRHLFLIFKEALTNIARHSGSANVLLMIEVSGDQLRVEIADDGSGFVPAGSSDVSQNGSGGHGLGNMRTRAAELAGHLEIDSTSGSGTKIILLVPISQRHGMNMLFSRWRK